jgi:hypothetical protein
MNAGPATVDEYIENFPASIQARTSRRPCHGSAGGATRRRAGQLSHASALPERSRRVLRRLQEPSGPVPARGRPCAPGQGCPIRWAKGQSTVPVQPACAPPTHRRHCASEGHVQCSQSCSKARPVQRCFCQAPRPWCRRRLTLRSRRPSTAWHLGREPVVHIIGLAAQAPIRGGRLSSNVRPHSPHRVHL